MVRVSVRVWVMVMVGLRVRVMFSVFYRVTELHT